ncbi:hypothetical protein [Micromonospora sp. RTGN7]|uniref:hypothetical protein n=1 Tax=Micromonospora sp. RTGN7 TaxID=3016526 RepID=UPI0029FEE1CF|nr:hypothetical protein [Micromonospora sp. RTGN7]
MKNNEIIINQAYLTQLQGVYTGQVDEIDKVYGKVVQYGNLPDSTVDMTKPFVLRLGGAKFAEAVDMVGRLDTTRSGLAARFSSARAQLYALEYGIKFLLAEADTAEELNALSSTDFEGFIPKSGL